MTERPTLEWRLSDLPGIESNGRSVLSCFHCGGGSTMGYRLAGFDVLGGVEIDPKMMGIYRANHHPKHSYLMPVGEFNALGDHPEALRELDILDGSPPCSSFSTSGARDKKWGKSIKFHEGQAVQRLDDLFFDFIRTAEILQPKVVVAENVTGLIVGKARGYVKQIFRAFKAIGYRVQLFVLDASRMGVPQRRRRTFFVASKETLGFPELSLDFAEPLIPFSAITEGPMRPSLRPLEKRLWPHVQPGDRHLAQASERATGKCSYFTHRLAEVQDVLPTMTARGPVALVREYKRPISLTEMRRSQTFPVDYDFGAIPPQYVMGMSVPPFMAHRVASQIYQQWFA